MADEAETAPARKRGRPSNAEKAAAAADAAPPAAAEEAEAPFWAEGVNYRGPKPHFPIRGESWQEEIGGPVKYFHGNGWYLENPSEQRAEPIGEPLSKEVAAQAGIVAGEPEESGAEDEAEVVADLSEEDTALMAIEGDDEELDPDMEEFEPADAEGIESTPAEPEQAETVYDGGADAQFQPVGDGEEESDASPVIDRLEHFADDLELDAGFLVEDARDFMLDLFKSRPKPWSATSEQEQRDIAAAIEQTMTEFVRKVVETVRADPNTQPIRCLLEGYSEKDGIKVNLKVKSFTPEEELAAVVGLHKARGKTVLVTVASVDDYRGGRDAETLPDQSAMEFEAGELEDDEGEGS